MKKIFLAALLAVSIGTSAFSASAKNVNDPIRDQFAAAFDNAQNVTWINENDFVVATFTIDGNQMKAFYNYDGDFIGTSKVFAFDKLPKNGLTSIMQKYPYPPYKLQECIEFVNADGEKNYFVSFEKDNQMLVLQIYTEGSVQLFVKE